MRYAAIVEYDGSQFNGWQIQPHAPSVQAVVEAALAHVADEPIRVHTAGRTDTGVHAVGQVIHFDTDKQRSNYSWLRGANTKLPDCVAIKWINPVEDDFHARFSAQSRCYRYIMNTRKIPLGILADYVSRYPLDLDVEAMQSALPALLGTHDFSAYRASGCQSMDPIKTMHSLEINQYQDWIWLDIRGNGFLQHMVRNVVGVLLKIGAGERASSWAAEVLESKDRNHGGVTAKPNGLYFVEARYEKRFALPDSITPPEFW
jgi:tRNA pseudouridine38-40 synthase